MWSGKMAARMRRIDGVFNADNYDFPTDSCHHELLSPGDEDGMNSCTDHSILSILEEPTVAGEDKSGVEAESESLLSALSEMLDSVEDDDDESLSPFDVLPDTKLLTQPRHWDTSVVVSVGGRAATRPAPPNLTVTIKRDREGDENRVKPLTPQSQTFKSKRTESEVEVFTSSSLVNLVKLMHPYCLRLRVEEEKEEGGIREDRTLFSQEEVWRYERPTEENDEEINVVSDEEEPVSERRGKEEEAAQHPHGGRVLKSVLLNGNSPRAPPRREKKRVSFGPVQVASYDDSAENDNERSPVGGSTSEMPPAPQSTPPADVSSDKETAPPPKAEAKAKSLSLQQYRQLRQKRRPLVEKQGNNTTKWPSITEPPKELTPILNLQRHHSCGPKIFTDHVHKPGKKTVSHHATPPPRPLNASYHIRLKRPCPESTTVSPTSPLPGCTTNPNMKVQERSPVKKQKLLSIDPPNPVLVPLPVHHAAQPSADPSSSQSKMEFPQTDSDLSTAHLHKTQSGSSAQQRHPPSPEPKPLKQDHTTHPQDIHNNLTPTDAPPALSPAPSDGHNLLPHTARPSPTKVTGLEPKTPPQTPRRATCPPPTSPAPVDSPLPTRSVVPDVSPVEATLSLQVDCRLQSAASDSGIEASDLTSLLEQFEETQAIEERVCERGCPPGPEPRLLQSSPVGASGLSSHSDSPQTLKPLGNRPQLPTLAHVDVPEPLSTEVILRTQQGQPTRRRNPPSKSIQIIEPRPLPSRRSHVSASEPAAPAHASAHMYLSVSSDHDYCGSVDRSLTGQHAGAKTSPLPHVPELPHEPQGAPVDSATQTPTTHTTCLSEKRLVTRTATETSTDTALQFTDSDTSEARAASYTLPTPPPTPPDRGRGKTRYRRRSASSGSSSSSCRSSSSSSCSSSASRSPKRQRLHRSRSDSSSCSSSSCRSISPSPPRRHRRTFPKSRKSRSRSRSWSCSRSSSRSRSPSPRICRRQWKDVYRSRESRRLRREHELRIQKLKAIDERRVVYVGRIRRSMTHEELRERFSQFGVVEGVSLHFRERGDHFGFVTFSNMEDAFAAIDNAGKLRRPDELPFDICFGGRRQFCNSNYSDLDANRDVDPPPARSRFKDVDFDSLLKQAQRGLRS